MHPAIEQVQQWIENFVEQPRPELKGWPPCPYARRARLQQQISVTMGKIDPYTDLMDIDLEDLMVAILIYNPTEFEADMFNRQVDNVNQGFSLPRNLIALADHPDDKEEVNGICMNQGQWALVLVQSLDKLNHFAGVLAQQGYYDNWPDSYLTQLFRWREDPRS